MLLLVLFHQTLHEIQFTGGQGVADTLFEIGNALVVDHFGRGQLQWLDLLPCRLFDGAQHAPFAGRDKQDGLALAAGTAGTADAMDIGLGVIGDIVIDHVADAFHIQATCRDIGCNQDIQ